MIQITLAASERTAAELGSPQYGAFKKEETAQRPHATACLLQNLVNDLLPPSILGVCPESLKMARPCHFLLSLMEGVMLCICFILLCTE